jgi:hypothetical protein
MSCEARLGSPTVSLCLLLAFLVLLHNSFGFPVKWKSAHSCSCVVHFSCARRR